MDTNCTNIDWLKKQDVKKQVQLLKEFAKEVNDLYLYYSLDELLSKECDSPARFQEAFKIGQGNAKIDIDGWNKPVGYLLDKIKLFCGDYTDCIKVVYDLKDYADIMEEAYPDELENWLKGKR